jgi:hypothetical protein
MVNNFITFDEATHTYKGADGLAYKSVSKVIESIKNKFDTERMSKATATKMGVTQEDVLKIWDAKKDSSIVWGNTIHNALELYHKEMVLPADEGLKQMVLDISEKFLSGWSRQYEEMVLHSVKYGIAGTADKILLRSSRNNIMDIRDYKTNEARGIEYVNKYNKFCLAPLQHLEDCNFNHYALQQSIYGVMLEEQGYRIGNLGIIFIDKNLQGTLIPVPYMRLEAIEIMKCFGNKAYYHIQEENW